MARRREQLRLWLAQPALWEEPCRGAGARLGETEVRETVSRLGRLRFHQKQSRFAAALGRAGANQVLYEGLLRAVEQVSDVPEQHCTACFSGKYPTKIENHAGKLILERK